MNSKANAVVNVYFDSTSFEQTYRKRPSGRGSWAFFTNRRQDGPAAFWSTGMWSDARKAATTWAKSVGVDTVYVGT